MFFSICSFTSIGGRWLWEWAVLFLFLKWNFIWKLSQYNNTQHTIGVSSWSINEMSVHGTSSQNFAWKPSAESIGFSRNTHGCRFWGPRWCYSHNVSWIWHHYQFSELHCHIEILETIIIVWRIWKHKEEILMHSNSDKFHTTQAIQKANCEVGSYYLIPSIIHSKPGALWFTPFPKIEGIFGQLFDWWKGLSGVGWGYKEWDSFMRILRGLSIIDKCVQQMVVIMWRNKYSSNTVHFKNSCFIY